MANDFLENIAAPAIGKEEAAMESIEEIVADFGMACFMGALVKSSAADAAGDASQNIYNVETGQLATWNPPTNPPFHTIIFPAPYFWNPTLYLGYYKDFKSHEDIPRVFNAVTLDMNRYMVSYHGKHISTAYESPLIKKAYHKMKYGRSQPFKGKEIESRGYLYSVSGKNISTRWRARTTKTINPMIGAEFTNELTKEQILKDFGIWCI